MATLEDAVKAQVLELYRLPDWEQRLPIRLLWVAYELWDWTDNTGALHDMALGVGRRTLFEHLEQTFCDFRCSPRFTAGDLKRMMPTAKGRPNDASPQIANLWLVSTAARICGDYGRA
jgi:hypothetical protein